MEYNRPNTYSLYVTVVYPDVFALLRAPRLISFLVPSPRPRTVSCTQPAPRKPWDLNVHLAPGPRDSKQIPMTYVTAPCSNP